MKLLIVALILMVTITLNVTAYDHSDVMAIIDVMPQNNQGSSLSLVKRKESSKKKSSSKNKNQNKNKNNSKNKKKKYSNDCKTRVCSLVLKPCPKDCPMSCGYIDSPDPCCPLLGKPSCPDY